MTARPGRCGRLPLEDPKGWDGCTRSAGHTGPCAHAYAGDASTRRFTTPPEPVLSLVCSRCGAKNRMGLEEAVVLSSATNEIRCVVAIARLTPLPAHTVPCGGRFFLELVQ